MAYTVFALKWRPQNFDDIIGQKHVAATLKNALEKNRLAHAYLFSGPRGVGKTSTARILAKALNCKEGPTADPCSKCSSCTQIAQGRSLDVIEIDGASNRGIDEIRALRENVKFAPVGGKYKVYIIDEVHMLTTEAFNALLKTLEEPPEFVKFVFATTHPHKVIPTILSRCQRFDFRRIPTLEIIGQLEKIVSAEKINIDKDVLLAIAKSSDGSLRDAESVLDQLVSFSSGKVSLKDAISILGLVEQEALFNLADLLIKKDAKGALGLFNNIIDQGKDPAVFLSSLIEHFRNLMVAKITSADSALIDLPAEICARLLKQAQVLSIEEILAAFNILVNAQEMSKRLDSMRIPLEIAIVRLGFDKKGQSQAPINKAGSDQAQPKSDPMPPKNISSAPVKKASPAKNEPPQDDKPIFNYAQGYVAPVRPSAPQVVPLSAPVVIPVEESMQISLEQVCQMWPQIIEMLGKAKMSLATYLNQGTPVSCQKNTLTVSFSKNHSLHKESLERKESKALIEKNIAQIFKTALKINFTLSQEEPAKDSLRDQASVKSALDIFGARVLRED